MASGVAHMTTTGPTWLAQAGIVTYTLDCGRVVALAGQVRGAGVGEA